MSTEPRRIALASPLRYGKPRFAVGGQGQAGSGDIKLYEWIRERQEMRMVGLQTDLGQIRAMAWSPHPSYPSILATGLSTGRTTLHTLSPSTLSPSPNQPNLPLATLNIKHSRPVTSLTFSPLDPNYIAAGLERHRSDHSLLVWDVADAIASSSPGVPANWDSRWSRPGERIDVTNAHPTSRISEPRHLQAYCASEMVNACAFMPASYSLLASTNNRQIRLFDLRSSHTSAPPRDAAAAGAGAVLQYQTRAVYGLTPHPTRIDRFASFEIGQGQAPSAVRLWDTRMTGEVLSFEVAEAIVGLEWWGESLRVGMKEGGVSLWDMVDGRAKLDDKDWVTVGGMRNVVKPKVHLHSFAFASSEEDGDVLFVGKDGIINIAPITNTLSIATSPQGDLAIATTSPGPRIITPSISGPAHGQQQPGRPGDPAQPQLSFPQSSSNTLQPYQTSDARQPLTPAAGPSRRRLPHEIPEAEDSDSEVEDVEEGYERWRVLSGEDIGVVMRKRATEDYGLTDLRHNAGVAARYTGAGDLSGTWHMVNHITEYMSTNSSKSPDSKFDLTHQGIWGMWTGQIGQTTTLSSTHPGRSGRLPPGTSRNAYLPAGESSVREPIRQGSAAWASLKSQTGTNTNQPQQPAAAASGTTSSASGFRARTLSSTSRAGRAAAMNVLPQVPAPSDEYLAAVSGIHQTKAENGLVGSGSASHSLPSGKRTACRRMILALCEGERGRSGLGDDQETTDEPRTRKAAWAYFRNDEAQAIRILLDSSDARHRLTGATLATSLIRSGMNRKPNPDEWKSVIEGMDDPYIRAVLRRLGGEGWESVLREGGKEGLDMVDRIIIAVNNLNDKELSEYLHALYISTLEPSSSTSLSSAIVLLGLSNHLVPYLQSHLDAHADLQTTALLAALIPSKYLSQSQQSSVERWTEGYRDLLDTWRLFTSRVDFDVKRQEVAREFSGRAGMSDVVKGNCPVCNHILSRQELDHAQRKVALKGTTTWPNERTSTCTFCGNALPRCVICLTHVESKFKAGPGLDDQYLPTGNDPFDTIDTAYVACQTCRHGGHALHILSWFEGGLDGQKAQQVCPVVGCDCECATL